MVMAYDGALVMPSNYAVMEQEEMTYVEGGFSDTIFRNNLKGAWNSCSAASKALRAGGLTWGTICTAAFSSVSSIVAYYGITINTVALCIGGIVAEIVATVALVAGINYLGNNRVWY